MGTTPTYAELRLSLKTLQRGVRDALRELRTASGSEEPPASVVNACGILELSSRFSPKYASAFGGWDHYVTKQESPEDQTGLKEAHDQLLGEGP